MCIEAICGLWYICFHNLKKGSIPTKDFIIPHLPRRHFCSCGQLPMPFSFSPLNQDSVPSFSPGSAPCVVPFRAGAVTMQEPHSCLFNLRKHFSGNAFEDWIPRDAYVPNHFNIWALSLLYLADFYYVTIYTFQN